MEILERINELRNNRGWSIYKLAEESGLTQSTLANMFSRKTMPSISTLKSLCDAFGITLSQFFEFDSKTFSDDEMLMINKYKKLKSNEKTIVKNLIDSILNTK